MLSVVATPASGSCLPNAVSSELCCLAPEQAKSKHSTLWLKGHLSRGGNPASSPKSINRGGLLSHGAAHCHGNAPSEWAEALILHPPIVAAAFQGSLTFSAQPRYRTLIPEAVFIARLLSYFFQNQMYLNSNTLSYEQYLSEQKNTKVEVL